MSEETLDSFDLFLILGGVASSVAVVGLDSFASMKVYRSRREQINFNAAIMISAAFSIALCLLACVYIAREGDDSITTGVFSSTLISLLPAASVIPSIRFNLLKMAWHSLRCPSLVGDLTYLRFLPDSLGLDDSQPRLVIRKEKNSSSKRLPKKRKEQSHNTDVPRSIIGEQLWHGKILDYSGERIILRDNHDGDSKRWWSRVRSLEVMCNPSLGELESWKQVLNAQALIAEIVMIGDALAKLFGKYFKAAFEDPVTQLSFGSSNEFMCEHLLTALGLQDWQYPPRAADGRHTPAWPDKGPRTQRNRMMFHLLANRSSFFTRERGKTMTARFIVEKHERNDVDLNLEQDLKEWLLSWGFEIGHPDEVDAGLFDPLFTKNGRDANYGTMIQKENVSPAALPAV